MLKLNKLDKKGAFISDYITEDESRPENWTADLVGDGFYKAVYKNAVKDTSTGEWSGGEWIEEGGPSMQENQLNAEATLKELRDEANSATYPLSLKIIAGRKLTTSEAEKLNAWIDYTDALDAIDTSNAPDIKWPAKP